MKARPDTERRHVLLRSGDFEKLRALFPRAGPSTIIRHIVSNMLDTLEAEQAQVLGKSIKELASDADIRRIVEESLAELTTIESESEEPGHPV
jgi:hypothetical protein